MSMEYKEALKVVQENVERLGELKEACEEIMTLYDVAENSYQEGMEDGQMVLDKIRAEIREEAEYAYADFDGYKNDVLQAEPDELPDDDFRYGLERAVEIINKYKAESD